MAINIDLRNSLSILVKKLLTLKRSTRVVFAAALILTSVAAVAIQRFFDRPGENTLALVPSDSAAVAVLDLTPGIGQLGAFRKIWSTIQDSNFDPAKNKYFDKMLGSYTWTKEILPFLKRSAVIAWRPNSENKIPRLDSEILTAFLPISSVSTVRTILAKHLDHTSDDNVFKVERGGSNVAIVRETLVITKDSNSIGDVQACAAGKKPSFSSLDRYRDARKSIDADANLKLFISEETFRRLGEQQDANIRELSDSPGWFAAGIAIRDHGLALSTNVPMDPHKWEPFKALSSIKPIRGDLLAHLPAGAYDLAVVSQPSALWDFARDAWGDGNEFRRTVRDITEIASREVGIDLNNSMKETLGGTAVYASYPSSADSVEGIDMLFLLDDSNGASPADLVDRLRRFVNDKLGQRVSDERVFTPLDLGKTEAYALARLVRLRLEDEELRYSDKVKQKLLRGKTLAFATVGHAVIVATSEDLLTRAVKAYQGDGDRLSGDPKFSANTSFGDDGPQMLYAMNVSRVSDAISKLEREFASNRDDRDSESNGYRDMVHLAIESLKTFDAPFRLSLRAREGDVGISAFIPLEYDAISKMVKQGQDLYQKSEERRELEVRQSTLIYEAQAIARANAAYSNDYGDVALPSGDDSKITNLLKPYVQNQGSKFENEWEFNPALKGHTSRAINYPYKTPVIRSRQSWDPGKVYVGYFDGHAERVSEDYWNSDLSPLTKNTAFSEPPLQPVSPINPPPGNAQPVSPNGASVPSSSTSASPGDASAGSNFKPTPGPISVSQNLLGTGITLTANGNWRMSSHTFKNTLDRSEYKNASGSRIVLETSPKHWTDITKAPKEFDQAFARHAATNGYRNYWMQMVTFGGASALGWEFEKQIPGMGLRRRRIFYFNTSVGSGAVVFESDPQTWTTALSEFETIIGNAQVK